MFKFLYLVLNFKYFKGIAATILKNQSLEKYCITYVIGRAK